MISMVRTRLQYSYCPVVELVEELALREDLSNLKFIKKCVQNCKESVDFPVAWRESLSDKMNVDALKPMDIESLIAFGETLGTTAIEGQLACCDLYKSIIDENLSSARLDMKKYSKLFPALGTLMGIGISVIVI